MHRNQKKRTTEESHERSPDPEAVLEDYEEIEAQQKSEDYEDYEEIEMPQKSEHPTSQVVQISQTYENAHAQELHVSKPQLRSNYH